MDSPIRINKALSLLGLSEIEITTYLDLLKLGGAPASLIARRLKLNRSTTRYTLENLCKKRFTFQENRNGSFYFTAENPEKILLLLQDEQRNLEQKEGAVSQIIGDLKSLKNPHINIPKVRFFEGVEGIIKMYEDVLEVSEKTKCDLYGYAHLDYNKTYPDFLNFIDKVYVPQRTKIGNKSFFIYNNSKENQKYLKNDKKLNRTTLLIPEDEFPFKTAFHIYGAKISFSSQLKNEPPTGIIIEHESIRNSHFNLFKMAWNFGRNLPINERYKDVSLDSFPPL